MPASDTTWQALAARIRRDLGDGMVDVELTDDQLNDAIHESLQEFRATASPAYKDGYMFLNPVLNQRIYAMPDYVIDVLDVQRLDYGFIAGIEGTQFGTYLYEFMLTNQPFDIASYYIQRSFLETLNTLAAAYISYRFHSGLNGGQIGYGAALDYTGLDTDEQAQVPETSPTMEWDDRNRLNGPYIELLNVPKTSDSTYLLHIQYSRTDAELMNDIETGRWIHYYARACAKVTLGGAYRKVSGQPGPGGSLDLPGDALISEGNDEKDALKDDLFNLKYGEEPWGFLWG